MSKFTIQSKEQAKFIINTYENECNICSDCPLHTPEGWKCSYLYEVAKNYIKRKEE